MPSTDSFTGSALCVSAGTSAAMGFVVAFAQYDERGFYCKIDPTGVTVTKASSFGGSQGALTFPITRDEAKALAETLLRVAS